MLFSTRSILFAAAISSIPIALATPISSRKDNRCCQRTTVAILGAGVAGITAAQALVNQSITDFIVVEYNGKIGGRAKSAQLGKNKETGLPYTIELGANWVEGLGSKHGPENPIWSLAKKWELTNHYSNYSNILTYNETGEVDYSDLLDEYDEKYELLSKSAGEILQNNFQHRSTRAGLSLVGWKPGKNMAAQAVEWWSWDWETAQSPEVGSLVFGIAANNLTFNQFSDESNFVIDPRGFSAFIKGEASTFLKDNDPRLLLNTVVERIDYSNHGVTVRNEDGSCIYADYAICTFSLGVLQNEVVEFSPPLPDWKKTSIEMIQMGTYTKIFLQFEEQFWPNSTEFFLYAHPQKRGYYPVWQSLSTEGFYPGSNILFATVVGDESYRIEAQSDNETLAEVMEVLREMFPNIDIPKPIDFLYPRWGFEPWALGSYSSWPVGTTLEMHQNLRANVGRLWFAGEALSAQYLGSLQGAWFEGKEAGSRIAGLLGRKCSDEARGGCGQQDRYERLHSTTPLERYNIRNGWPISSFDTSRDEDRKGSLVSHDRPWLDFAVDVVLRAGFRFNLV